MDKMNALIDESLIECLIVDESMHTRVHTRWLCDDWTSIAILGQDTLLSIEALCRAGQGVLPSRQFLCV